MELPLRVETSAPLAVDSPGRIRRQTGDRVAKPAADLDAAAGLGGPNAELAAARDVFPASTWRELSAQMTDRSPSEHGLFLLGTLGRGPHGVRLMISGSVTPNEGDFEIRDGHALRPTGQYVSRAVGEALADKASLVFVHSHPNVRHPSNLSRVDVETSDAWAATFVPLLDSPFASLVWTPLGMEGVVYDADLARIPARVEAVGERRRQVLSLTRWSRSIDEDLDDRQTRALGDLGNDVLRGLQVAVVGAGGTGSALCDQLARMGVARILVIDDDVLDTASNLRRVIGATIEDLAQGRPKVDVVAEHLKSLALGAVVDGKRGDIRDDGVALDLLDVDVIVNTSDTHSSRAVLNQMAQQYGIALIDSGCAVGTGLHGVTGMPAEIRAVLPDGPCLWCLGVLDPGRIRSENLPPEMAASELDEGYGADPGRPAPSLAALNGFAASLAALCLLRLHSRSGLPGISVIVDGWSWYTQEASASIGCVADCEHWRMRGDLVRRPTRHGVER